MTEYAKQRTLQEINFRVATLGDYRRSLVKELKEIDETLAVLLSERGEVKK